MPDTINVEWLNGNALRAYPIKEDSSRIPVDVSGNSLDGVVLPDYLIVDFILTMPGISSTTVYLAQLGLIGNLITMVLKDASDIQVGTVSVDLSAHVTNQGYAISGMGTYEDIIGRIVLGDVTNLSNDLADGLYNFTLNTAPFELSTVRPMLRGIRSLRIEEQSTESDYIFGHVKLLAGRNIQLTYLPAYNAIRIDAIDGTGFTEDCDCPDEIGKTNIVRTINGIPLEDVEIVGDGQCTEVTVNGNTINIADICSTPCCGCPELEAITQQLNVLEASIARLESFANQLNERIQSFVTNYILTIAA